MKITDLQASNPSVYSTDKFSDHSYGDFYDALFSGKENAELNILEIGIDKGGSVRLWHDYLKKANIYGLDINPINPDITHGFSNRLKIYSGNAYDGMLFSPELFDVIIEDGSHLPADQIYAIKNFPAYLKPGGILIIEDVPAENEQEILRHKPEGVSVEVVNLRSVKGRWDDCLIVFKKD